MSPLDVVQYASCALVGTSVSPALASTEQTKSVVRITYLQSDPILPCG
jgi:hypothetical protein